MKELERGHVYMLAPLGGGPSEFLVFVRRSSEAIDYGPGEHSGTNTQEVLRALIDRTEYLYNVLPAVETKDAAYFLRMALFCYEARAWRRKRAGQNGGAEVNEYEERYDDVPFNEQDIEKRPIGPDGHIIT